jgi:hypothetical protein
MKSAPVFVPSSLGPDSPLLTAGGNLRAPGPSEADAQIAYMALCVGAVRKGQPRRMGDGMTGRYPELYLLRANNPNKGGQRSKAARGFAKAMGLLRDVPDITLPVARGPFTALELEFKKPGEYGTPNQRAMAELLCAQGHCVVEVQGCQEALDVTLGYLGFTPHDEWVLDWASQKYGLRQPLAPMRAKMYEQLKPRRR